MAFIGRQYELSKLEKLYQKKQGNLVALYGRRRVGKSTLIEHFTQDKPHLHFDGQEGAHTTEQVAQFSKDLKEQVLAQTEEPLLAYANFKTWHDIFDYLTIYFEKQPKKVVIFLDEFQWLAAGKNRLVSLIKSYWDRKWQKQNVMLILCGSVSSFMVKRIVHSTALYGRLSLAIRLRSFMPAETSALLNQKRSQDEIMRYALILGGIPKYLQALDPNQSFEQNINQLLFTQDSELELEYEKIFYSQFREHKRYAQIANLLIERPKSLHEIAKQLKLKSGGSLKSYLENLESASFITSYTPYQAGSRSKLKRYKLTDEYLRFYYKYVLPHRQTIEQNTRRNLFTQFVTPAWQSWLGFAFENFCLKHAMYLAEKMGFDEQVLSFGPSFKQKDTDFQVDLVYKRQDRVITVCEIKYLDKPIGVEIVHEMDKKCAKIDLPKGYTLEKALICRFGIDESLKTLKYFHHILTVDELF